MFFDNSPNNKNKNKNVSLHNTQLPKPKEVELIGPYDNAQGPAILDIECYPNYFECGFKFIDIEKYLFFEIFKGIADEPVYSINGYVCSFDVWRDAFSFVLHRFLTIGFNSIYYDLPLIFDALKGSSPEKLKDYSNEIISERKRAFSPQIARLNHIDIMEVAPLHDGLKTYAGRIHAPRMQELPYKHFKPLTPEQAFCVRSYNVNDLDNTELLHRELKGQIRLREKLGLRYGLDLRSKSDAQVAEAVIQSELSKAGIRARAPAIQPGSVFRYSKPDFIQFKTAQLQRVLEVVATEPFVINDKGKVNLPKAISGLKIKIGDAEYKFGIGGIHSKEKSATYIAKKDLLIVDRDVSQYYPSIVLNQNLYPAHLGQGFTDILRNLASLRGECKDKAKQYKDAGDIENYIYWDEESGSLKIANNGVVGKLSSPYSVVYSPMTNIQTTISGQLCLLMIAETLTELKFNVVSANTDGIVTIVPTERKAEFDTLIEVWEKQTGFKTEETFYQALYSRDVNNYLALKEKGNPGSEYVDEQLGFKSKGVYSERGSALNSVLSKNPETYICSMAVMQFLKNGIPLKDTIYSCKDFRRFVSVKKVEGGAQKDGQYLGKVVRWYMAKDVTGSLNYVTSGNSVGKSDGAKPCMDLPAEFPEDVDFDWYLANANSMLFDLGVYKKAVVGDLFR